LLHEGLGVAARLRQNVFPVLHDPPGVLDLVALRLDESVHHFEKPFAVQQRRRRQLHRLRLLDHILQLFQSRADVHLLHSPETLPLSATASFHMAIRSSREKSGSFAGFWRTAATNVSKWRLARSMTSRWPPVTGSNVPGHRAVTPIRPPRRRGRGCPRTSAPSRPPSLQE